MTQPLIFLSHSYLIFLFIYKSIPLAFYLELEMFSIIDNDRAIICYLLKQWHMHHLLGLCCVLLFGPRADLIDCGEDTTHRVSDDHTIVNSFVMNI